MATINQLSAIDVVQGSDLVPIYDSSNGDARKASMTQVNTFIQAQTTGKQAEFVAQYSAPTTGSTVQITDSSANTWLILTPAGTLSALTIKFPALANCIQGQEIVINCTQILTTITWNINGASNITGNPSTFSAVDAFIRFKFDAVLDTWYRVG